VVNASGNTFGSVEAATPLGWEVTPIIPIPGVNLIPASDDFRRIRPPVLAIGDFHCDGRVFAME